MWFRRDLRLDDNTALCQALKASSAVHCVFVFDRPILDALEQRADRRLCFIRESLLELDAALKGAGGGLIVCHGDARLEIPRLAAKLASARVYANRDYEPAALERDAEVARRLAAQGGELLTFKDQVIFENRDLLNRAGRPYAVYTPYRNAWLSSLRPDWLTAAAVPDHLGRLVPPPEGSGVPSLAEIGFEPVIAAPAGGISAANRLLDDFTARIDNYHLTRDYPGLNGPSRLSVHLRFGTLSIRRLVALAWHRTMHQGSRGAEVWLGELIWRDFYQMLLAQHPHTVSACFQPACDGLVFDEAPDWFAAWCQGRTGYPLVDAAMRQLNSSGYMHNRLRMLAASFLVKDLGIDWRLGERYFARQLNDYDLAANIGGWQWAASVGCDAQPWFRIFNPLTQSRKFDADGSFIRRHVPEIASLSDRHIHAPWLAGQEELERKGLVIGRDYPPPLVDHNLARQRTLARYRAVRPSPTQ